jgi:hypothetical protein
MVTVRGGDFETPNQIKTPHTLANVRGSITALQGSVCA